MKIPDNILRQYFELATDLTTDEINTIMMGDVREAHMLFAKELLKMYDDINEFEKAKERYLQVAKGSIPDDIEEFNISEKEINICELLIKINFANSKGEAKRMIQGNGVKINSDENPPTLEIRRGWLSNTMKYSLDGWTGRYGMPLEFLLAVHQATLMPDLAYDMVKTFDTKVMVLLHKIDDGTAIGAYKTDGGNYVTYEEMQEAAPTFEIFGVAQKIDFLNTFSNKEAKRLMKLFNINLKLFQ